MNKSQASNRKVTRVLLLIGIAAAVIGLDQLTKWLVRTNMEIYESIPPQGIFRLVYTTNSGGAFGIFASQTFLLAVVAIIGVLVFLIYLRYIPLESTLLKVGLGLDLGGAVGNLIDRLRFREVTDFIHIGAWPVFNLADSAIVVGTILIVCYLLFSTRKKTTVK